MGKIPSDEDFARADRLDEERNRNLDIVSERVMQKFIPTGPLVKFYILPEGDVDFRAYVFFKNNKDILKCERSGATSTIVAFVLEQLELLGRGRKGDIKLAVEVDSDENVAAKFHGNYFQ